MNIFMGIWTAISVPLNAVLAATNFSNGHAVMGALNVSAAVLILTFFVAGEIS